ncbi:MAG: ABC transporter permease [Candidatus Methanogaster sp.]|uniref:ABC transporter permease n=1 Tax=Candidatus Methanogaster sp. TaxID=3386292 RepID=A0AC61L5K4_9EURY|nr:MAG: ABC transporter permease [ANME-2 cluster archaeon]
MRIRNILDGFIPIIVFALIWEFIARIHIVPEYIFPPFSAVMLEFYHLTVSGVLLDNLASSLFRVLVGFFLGSLAGIMMGTVMGCKGFINRSFHPIASLLYPIPTLGWAPLLMIWIGINEMLPIVLIFLCSFFPVLYNTITGIRSVDSDVINAARTLGASDLKILTTVILPLAVPNIFTGLRLEAGMAWRVVIAAEMVAIPTGIGALLIRSESLLRVDVIIVCLMVLSVMCLAFERVFQYIETRLTEEWR